MTLYLFVRATVLELTDGIGADQVLEVTGSTTLEKSFGALKVGGLINQIGMVAGQTVNQPNVPMLAIMSAATLRGIYVGSRKQLEDLGQALTLSGLRPLITKVFDFSQAKAAYQTQFDGGAFRSGCITPFCKNLTLSFFPQASLARSSLKSEDIHLYQLRPVRPLASSLQRFIASFWAVSHVCLEILDENTSILHDDALCWPPPLGKANSSKWRRVSLPLFARPRLRTHGVNAGQLRTWGWASMFPGDHRLASVAPFASYCLRRKPLIARKPYKERLG